MSETMDSFDRLQRKRQEVMKKLEAAARSVVPVLLDHKLENTAGELKALIYELDVIDGEVINLFKSDPQKTLLELLDRMERQR